MPARKYKRDMHVSYAIGVYPTLQLLKYRADTVDRILINPKGGENKGVLEIQRICREQGIPIDSATTAIHKLAKKENVYAVGAFRKYKQKLNPDDPHVVLVNPQNKGNLGTIIRTMIGFNIKNLVIITPGVDVFDPKVVRSSMGACFQLHFEMYPSFVEYVQVYRRKFYPLMTDGKTELENLDYKGDTAVSFVFGSESEGLSKEYHSRGESVRIDTSNSIDSLNLATSVGIVLYDYYVKLMKHA